MNAMTVHIPVLETERLILRAPNRSDFDAFAVMLDHPRTLHMGGPFDRAQAWRLFSGGLASWPLDGFGGWIITDKTSGAFMGEVSITMPLRFPEPELGWTLDAAAEGKGIAFEAASAALAWYWANANAKTLVSYVSPDNGRSKALASRLGANPDPAAPLPTGETRNETTVYRHPTQKEAA